MIENPPAGYPATYAFNPPDKIANWRPLVQWLLAFPHFVILYVLQFVSQIVAFVSWIIIVFTGNLPEGLAGVQMMYVRYAARTYSYVGFMREEYPPFTFETVAADPLDDPRVRVDFQPQLTDRNRLTVFFRFILAIPQFIVLAVLGVALYVVYIIAFFAVLFTGRFPEGLRTFVVGVTRWYVRVMAYHLLLTDVYPPFSLD
jgi:hypothetical protein